MVDMANHAQNSSTPKKLSNAELMAEVERLKAQNEKLLAKRAPKAIELKVSEKGGVSAYHIHSRFPVTLYKDQWLRLLEIAPSIRQFIQDNEAKLSVKE